MTSQLLSAAMLAFLTACGPMNSGGLGSQAAARLGAFTGLQPTAPPAPPALPTQALAAGPGNVLMVTLLSRNAVAAMTRISTNNGTLTWRTDKGVTLSFRDDILVASRGLGDDLMGADIPGVRDAIVQGSGTAKRTHTYLNSEDTIQTRDLACTYMTQAPETITIASGAFEATKVEEVCESRSLRFTNSYWLDGNTIVQSTQAVALGSGYIRVNTL